MNRGVSMGVAAYLLWGLSPIYWRLVGSIPSGDVVAFRIVAAALLLGAMQLRGRTLGRVKALLVDRRARWTFVLTAGLLGVNWVVFIWAVSNGRVVEASLGYFINPLISVVLGVALLRERLRLTPMIAVAIAAAGVLVLAIDLGTLPWVSLVLAGTFAVYGLIRKISPAGSLDGLTLEVYGLLPIALAVVVVRAVLGDGLVGSSVPGRDLWLLGSGVMTAVPLLLFAAAARRIPLWLVGMLQYIAPTIQFLLGVLVWGEEWSGGQAVGFIMIWIALAVFATEGIIHSRRNGAGNTSDRSATSSSRLIGFSRG